MKIYFSGYNPSGIGLLNCVVLIGSKNVLLKKVI